MVVVQCALFSCCLTVLLTVVLLTRATAFKIVKFREPKLTVILRHPYRNRTTLTAEVSTASIIRRDSRIDVTCDVNVSTIAVTHIHMLDTCFAITHDNGHPTRMFVISHARPSNDIFMIEIIFLVAVCVGMPGLQKTIDQKLMRIQENLMLLTVIAHI